MRPHHYGLHCPKCKRWNVSLCSQAHKRHVACVWFFFLRWKNCRVLKKRGAPCSYPLFKLIRLWLPAPVARILVPRERSDQRHTWKYTTQKLRTSNILKCFTVYYTQEWEEDQVQVTSVQTPPAKCSEFYKMCSQGRVPLWISRPCPLNPLSKAYTSCGPLQLCWSL